MPKVSPIQGSFNAGEFSPLLYGRVDAERYKSGLATCLNMIPLLQGGAARRPGTRYVAETKDSGSAKSRFIPFQFSTTQAYMLEFGNGYIRFFANYAPILSGFVPYEVATPYSAAEALELGYTQSNDVLYLTHPNHAPRKLQRFGNTNWLLSKIDFQDGPYDVATLGTANVNRQSATFLTALVGTVTGIQNVLGSPIRIFFSAAHGLSTGDRVIVSNSVGAEESWGIWTITATNATTIELNGSPTAIVNPWVSGGEVHFFVGYNVGNSSNQINLSATVGNVTVTTTSVNVSNAVNNGSGLIRITTTLNHNFDTGQSVFIAAVGGVPAANGTWVITKISDTQFDLQSSVFAGLYTAGGTAQLALFVSTDVGRLMRVREGTDTTWVWGNITQFNSSVSVLLNLRSSGLNGTTNLQYRMGIWSDTTGYPSRVVFHEDRLTFSGTRNYPQRIDFSNSSDYENFAPSAPDGTVADNNAVAISLNSNDTNSIQVMTSDERGLPVVTKSAEWIVRPSTLSEAITPVNISAKKVTNFGASGLGAIVAGKSTIYVQAGTRKVRELNYFYNVDGFRSTDVTLLSEHITGDGISSPLCFQKTPQPIIWATRQDGALLGMTFERDLDALKSGWARHELGGYGESDLSIPIVESVAVIPNPTGTHDDVWMIVKRYIDGTDVRYVEYMTRIFQSFDRQEDAFFVDCGVTYDVPKTVTGITQANPAVVTSAGHGFSNGDKVRFRDINGMSELNQGPFTIQNVAANTFELVGIDSTAYNAYISGGTVRKYVTTISGLTWLEGETVSILGDGAVQPDKIVSSGAITLSFQATTVQIGFGYKSDLKGLRIDAGSMDGTSIGKLRRIHEVSVMLERSLGLKIGTSFDKLDRIIFRTTSDPLTNAPSLFSGLIRTRIEATYDTENQVCLRQDQPLPFTLLAVMPRMETQDQG